LEQASPNNSPLRESAKDITQSVAVFIDEKFPRITPNQLTMARAVAALGVSALLAKTESPKVKFAGALGYTLFELADAVDGNLARIKAERNGEETKLNGNLIDALSDKAVESAACYLIAERSIRNGDKIGAAVNILAGITAPLPALFRARAEKHNLVVKESSYGTRPIRSALTGLDLVFGGNRVTSQILGATLAGMNSTTTIRRMGAVRNPDSKEVVGELNNDRKRLESRLRYPALAVFSLGSLAVGLKMLDRAGRLD